MSDSRTTRPSPDSPQGTTILPYGERAWMVVSADAAEAEIWIRHLERMPPDNLEEYVPGFGSVLLIFREPAARRRVEQWLREVSNAAPGSEHEATEHVIPVVYDGPDLEAVARAAGMETGEVVELHSGACYRVGIMGFAPGFPYLEGLDPRLHLERKASPRERIAPGSVAIGGPHAGIYTVASPGGWHLLGRTEAVLFRPEAARTASPDPGSVFTFAVGDRVRFVPAE